MSKSIAKIAVALASALLLPVAAAQQGPIRMHFDLHADPLPNDAPLTVKQGLYQDWCEWMSWVLDQTEPLGAQLAFLSGGQWMELAVAEGVNGAGAQAVRTQAPRHAGTAGRPRACREASLPGGPLLPRFPLPESPCLAGHGAR